ncbi:hypothetical protein ccbrp13_57830 [Ktedonobacteria bacterium brp13]|nr:hypothetical protein ccbrp13_57830 [Ktedonobacteria bacterium brp13]
MISSAQKSLFESVDIHLSSYLKDWLTFSTQRYTLPEQNIQDIRASITHSLYTYGLSPRFLDPAQTILYAASPYPAPYTLLLSLQLPSLPMEPEQQEAYMLPLFASITAYQHLQQLFHPQNQTNSRSPFIPIAPITPIAFKWLITLTPSHSLHATGTSKQASYTTVERIIQKQHSLLKADGCLLFTPHSELDIFTSTAEDPLETLPQLILGSRGRLQVELVTNTTTRQLPTHYGTIVPDAAWQLLWALNSIKDAREDVLIDDFYDQLKAPEDELLSVLATLAGRTHISEQDCGVAHLIAGLHGVQQLYAYFLTPSCSVTHLQCVPGMQPARHEQAESREQTALAGYARARLDFHLVPEQDPEAIFSSLQRHLSQQRDQSIEVHKITAHAPGVTSIGERLVDVTRTAFQAAYSRPPILVPLGANVPTFSLLRRELKLPTLAIALPWLTQTQSNTTQAMPAVYIEQLLKTFVLLFAEMGEKE